jgi:hypothetical protein
VKLLPVIAAAVLLAVCMTGCRGTDYDISEVASPEYLGLDEQDHDHSQEGNHQAGVANPYPFYDASFLCVNPHPSGEGVMEDGGSTELHIHDAGERNHGTGWFFNQPWAATFIWSKIVRDAVILLILAAVVLVISDRTLSHRRRR